ncbi:DUF3995 domain-containing protein [Flagellimonas hymeniacidonis]|uniref:DUF3995 domain-containing protein n=1 Tax=Flagellimonas hymeniacidonis TaxID=2603628 RepID=A0A5C8V151_9FLAO|nr:DUF3995 domain-containing protein [Flagellimonas hymeniacidonis]TXN35076.1 DUF3995 domain-containing protein [Flagellimonas hymeniacidonis]
MGVLSMLISITFIFLAGLHFYWAVFGIKDPSKVIPTKETSNKVKSPGKLAAAFVGIVLLFFAFVFINKEIVYVETDWMHYVPIGIGILFIIRALGDFKYVGFFKSAKNSKFSALDTRYYSPLCLLLGALIIILELLS